ncbi:MAG: Redoxin family protein, partial [Patescibacteria group bacterium]|nr:Redoxin family protein [Patescibacteria group bacterium]
LIATGADKKIESVLVRNNILNFVTLEQKILQKSVEEKKVLPEQSEEVESGGIETPKVQSESFDLEKVLAEKKRKYLKAQEIVAPSGYVNSGPFSLKDYIGKKVILIDFVTYSCINCQRTFPFLNAWYKEYEDDGLLIVGIHTPEFAFEKNIENVKKALDGFGIKFPVVLDNDYGTWKAYQNVYWPRKYLIDIDGFIVYDHVGEGKYEETEKKIQELLAERKTRLGEGVNFSGAVSKTITEEKIESASPEIYFGSMRNENLGNGLAFIFGEKDFVVPADRKPNMLYLGGKWDVKPEYSESKGVAEVYFKYSAKKMFMVASSDSLQEVGVYENGKFLKNIKVKDSQLYTLLENQSKESGEVMLKIPSGVKVFTFTFG